MIAQSSHHHRKMENKAFRNLIFTAADVTSNTVPETCCLIHFETCDTFGLKISEDRECVPVSKVLWCTDAQSGEIVDWMNTSNRFKNHQKSLNHSSSVYSRLNGLCASSKTFKAPNPLLLDKEQLGLGLGAGFDDTIQVNPKYRKIYETVSPDIQLVEYKAHFEAEKFALIPRDLETAAKCLDHALVLTKKCENNWAHICSVNDTWSELSGYTSADCIGESITMFTGQETDTNVTNALTDAINKRHDVSALVMSYRKNGSPFASRIRVVPIKYKSPLDLAGLKPSPRSHMEQLVSNRHPVVGYDFSQKSSQDYEILLAQELEDHYLAYTFTEVD